MQFSFDTDEESFEFAVDVVKALSIGFNMSEENALKLVNKEWGYIKLFHKDHPFHHELPEYFGNELFFGHSSKWWLTEKQRASMGLAPLAKKPLETSMVKSET